MRPLHALALATAAAIGLAACDGENFFKNSDVSVVGTDGAAPGVTYEAVRLEFENEAGLTLDLVDQGAIFLLTLDREEGTFASDLAYLDIDVQTTGTYTLEGDSIVFSDGPFADDAFGVERAYEFDDAGDVVFLRDPITVWDVDNDGVAEAASLDVRLDRRDD